MGGGNWATFGQEWSNYFLPGMLDYKTSFFWVLALTAVQVRWVNVEINFHFVLDLDGTTGNADRLDAKQALLQRGCALVVADFGVPSRRADLIRRAAPVFGREGVDGEHGNMVVITKPHNPA